MAQKEILGQPWWVWAAGGVALVSGYLWIRHSQNAAAAAASQQGQTPVFVGQGTGGVDSAALLAFLNQHQGQPHPTPVCPKGWTYDADEKTGVPEKAKSGGGGGGRGKG